MFIRIMFLFLFLHVTSDWLFFLPIFLFSIFLNEQILKKKNSFMQKSLK